MLILFNLYINFYIQFYMCVICVFNPIYSLKKNIKDN